MLNHRSLASGLTVSFLALAACDTTHPSSQLPPGTPTPPLTIDAQTAALTAETNLAAHLLALNNSGGFANDITVVKKLGLGFGSTPVCVSSPGGSSSCPPPTNAADQARQTAHHIVTALLDVATAMVSADGTSVTFQLQPSLYCNASIFSASSSGTSSSGSNGTPPPSSSQSDCQKVLSQVPVQLIASSRVAGDLDLALAIGTAHRQPLAIKLYRSQLSLDFDLSSLGAAITELEAPLDPTRRPELPTQLSGQISLSVAITGDRDATLSLSIPSAVTIADASTTLSIAPKSPMLSIHLDGNAQQISVSTDVGAIDGSMPLSWLNAAFATSCSVQPSTPGSPTPPTSCNSSSTGPLHGSVGIHLAGMRSDVALTRASDSVTLHGLSLGNDTSRLTYNGMDLLALDLNPSHGRSLDLSVGSGSDGMDVTVAPAFELLIKFGFSALVDQISNIPSWAQSDQISLILDSAAMPKVLFPATVTAPTTGTNPPPPSAHALVKVIDGALSLSSSTLGSPIRVASGQCLLGSSSSGSGSNSGSSGSSASNPIAQFTSGPCP